MTPDIAIIICTYNPDIRVLSRCLNAVAALKKAHLSIECILVDNNSNPAIIDLTIVQNFLSENTFAKLLIEKKQGLTNARICGFKNSRAPWLIFFDDDNEPDENYLIGVADFVSRNSDIGMFGPGHVYVRYMDKVEPYLEKNKAWFQDAQLDEELKSTAKDASFYPAGTGMIVKREVMSVYAEKFLTGVLQTKDRSANNLGGGGDSQILWTALSNGYSAGRTPLLKLNHLISESKTKMPYLKNIAFYSGFAALPSRIDFYPEERNIVKSTGWEISKFLYRATKIIVLNFYKPRYVYFSLLWQLGYICGIYQVKEKPTPVVLSWVKRQQGIK